MKEINSITTNPINLNGIFYVKYRQTKGDFLKTQALKFSFHTKLFSC